MKKGLLFCILMGVIFINLIGVVSAENIALDPTTTVSCSVTGRSHLTESEGVCSSINDGDYTTYFEGHVITTNGENVIMNNKLIFSEPKDIVKVNASAYGSPRDQESWVLFEFNDGTSQIVDVTYRGFEINGDWKDVINVTYHSRADTRSTDLGTTRLYEIGIWTQEAIPSSIVCTNLMQEPGVVVSNYGGRSSSALTWQYDGDGSAGQGTTINSSHATDGNDNTHLLNHFVENHNKKYSRQIFTFAYTAINVTRIRVMYGQSSDRDFDPANRDFRLINASDSFSDSNTGIEWPNFPDSKKAVWTGDSILTGYWENIRAVAIRTYMDEPNSRKDLKIYEIEVEGCYDDGGCTPEPTVTTCSGLCGTQTNNCGIDVDCGSCTPSTPSDVCESEDDVILKLYSSTNSHAARYDAGNYDDAICYSDYFETEYSGEARTCIAEPFLNLFQNSNSHVSIDDLTGYDIPICYGALKCEIVNTGDGEVCEGIIIASLYDEHNSHIAKGDFANYDYKVCCMNLYWSNMKDEPIKNSDLKDTVKLNAPGIVGDVKFEVYKDVSLWFDKNIISPGTKPFTTWVAGKDSNGDFNQGTYYFKVIANGETYDSRDFGEYGTLVVGSENNSPPTTRIITPVRESNYIVNQSTGLTDVISFTQISEDEDDDLDLTWFFGDGVNETFKNILTTKTGNTNYQYDSGGTKYVQVKVNEVNRIQDAKNLSRIYVYDEGINVFAIIDKPDPYNVQSVSGRLVEVSSNRTHVANCSFSSCPGASCYTVSDSLSGNNINCFDLSPNSLQMFWVFDQGTSYSSSLNGNYLTDYDKVVEFSRVFSNGGYHTLKLNVGYKLGG